jgi:hypothetical protein
VWIILADILVMKMRESKRSDKIRETLDWIVEHCRRKSEPSPPFRDGSDRIKYPHRNDDRSKQHPSEGLIGALDAKGAHARHESSRREHARGKRTAVIAPILLMLLWPVASIRVPSWSGARVQGSCGPIASRERPGNASSRFSESGTACRKSCGRANARLELRLKVAD